MQHKEDGVLESLFPEFALCRLNGLIYRLVQRAGWKMNAEMKEDFLQEVAVLLWQNRARILALPEPERAAYITVCVRHALYRFLRKELFWHACLASTVTPDSSLCKTEMRPFPPLEALCGFNLQEQVSRTDLVDALCALTAEERHLLDLYYTQNLSDGDISARLHLTPAGAKMRRHRLILKLRQTLHAPSEGEHGT